MCFANAFLLCLAWATVLSNAVDPAWWPLGGFEVIRTMTTISGLPLDLFRFPPLQWLMSEDEGWTMADMTRQQDVADFGQWFLLRTLPMFVHCGWVARFLRAGDFDCDDPRYSHEKGHSHGMIQIPICNPLDSSTTLQHLIDTWHDCLGLCRGTSQVGRVVVISLSRYLPDLPSKCLQRIVFSTTISMPGFHMDSDDIHFHRFDIIGFIFHLGQTAHTGHYRAVLRCRDQWMAYEDGKLPDIFTDLPDYMFQNVVMVFLYPSDGIADRMMADRAMDVESERMDASDHGDDATDQQ